MIQNDIRDQMKQAMIEKDSTKLNVLRGLLSAFTNELVAKKRKPDESLNDGEAMEVIRRNVKQRKDSIDQFEKGGRSDLAESEKAELLILEKFLPPQMTKEEVLEYVKAKQAETGMTDKSKAGQFMGSIMKDLKGKTDGQMVKEAVDSLFS
jgi:uncharacterized protein YqeY